MVEKALEHLEPGGWLLAARNDRAGRKGSLSEAFDAASRRAGVRLSSVEPANPGADFPHEASFPEGQPFRALLARRSQQ